MNNFKECPDCQGTGSGEHVLGFYGEEETICATCGGSGQIKDNE